MFSIPLPLLGGSSTGTDINPGVGSIVITGYAPTVSYGQHLSPGVGNIALSGYAPVISQGHHLAPGVGSIVITGYAPTVEQFFTMSITTAQARNLEAVFRRHGLIAPLVITPTSISDGTFIQSRSWDGTTETDTTTGMPTTGSPTGALIDKLARYYGIIDPVQVTATGRTDGTLTQTFGVVGSDITVTTL